jgi:Zn-dependent M28 family amino/carboxypeptidase
MLAGVERLGRRAIASLALAATLSACGSGGDSWDGSCKTSGPLGLMGCVETDRYLADLTTIAAPRVSGSAHWQTVQDLCADRLAELGFDVERHDYGTGVNIIGVKLGVTAPDEQVIVGAHYDHIDGCTGADDNATGVAGALELARVLSLVETDRTLIVACWDEEELGLIGSRAYAQRAVDDGDDIVIVWIFDMIGYKSDEPNSQTIPDGFDLLFLLFREEQIKFEDNERRADFIFWVADELAPVEASLFASYGEIIGLPTLGGVLPEGLKDNDSIADLRRSDHAPFWLTDIPAIFLNDTADLRYSGYHCFDGDDTIDRLDHEFSTQVVRATVGSVAEILGVR